MEISISRKRKQRPSNPLTGIFTRSKSRRYLHHSTRSGKFRPDPIRITHHHDVTIPVDDVNNVSSLLIKDLRSHRVFSHPIVLKHGSAHNPNPNFDSDPKSAQPGVKSDAFSAFVDFENPNLMGKCDSGVEEKKFEVGLSCNGSVSESLSPNFSDRCLNEKKLEVGLSCNGVVSESVSPNLSDKVLNDVNEKKNEVGFGCSGSLSHSVSPNLSENDLNGGKKIEENVQTTPPDAVVLVSQDEVKRSDGSNSSKKEVSPNKVGYSEDSKSNSHLHKTSVLKPCSRPRIFKAPNSFSYRRLLPYLMDIAKDTSSQMKPDTCAKFENGVSVKSVVSSPQDSLSNDHKPDEKQVVNMSLQEVTKEDEVTSSDPNLSACHAPVQTPINHSQENSQSYTEPIENHNVVNVSIESPKVDAPQTEQISSDNLDKLANANPMTDSHVATLSIVLKESPEVSAKESAVETPSQLSLYAAGECRTSQVEGFVSLSEPVSLAKGILKKNPRGCRGICNCLNCAAFRLHAEKAFEFSRNQLFDAEELVHDMMKELANLRYLVQRSADRANSRAIIPVNQLQEACIRASNVEVVARNRLSQMHEDLYVHCRTKPLQRPRVNFSSDVKKELLGEFSKQIN